MTETKLQKKISICDVWAVVWITAIKSTEFLLVYSDFFVNYLQINPRTQMKF